MTDRKRARTLAAEAVAAGDPLAWFERLYREADAGTAIVPWADLHPNPHLLTWLDAASSPAVTPSGNTTPEGAPPTVTGQIRIGCPDTKGIYCLAYGSPDATRSMTNFNKFGSFESLTVVHLNLTP